MVADLLSLDFSFVLLGALGILAVKRLTREKNSCPTKTKKEADRIFDPPRRSTIFPRVYLATAAFDRAVNRDL